MNRVGKSWKLKYSCPNCRKKTLYAHYVYNQGRRRKVVQCKACWYGYGTSLKRFTTKKQRGFQGHHRVKSNKYGRVVSDRRGLGHYVKYKSGFDHIYSGRGDQEYYRKYLS